MGHGVSTYAAPHAITAWDQNQDWHLAITQRQCWIERQQDELYLKAGGGAAGEAAANALIPPETYQIKGWTVKKSDQHEDWETMERKLIWAAVVRKQDKTVYALNSSQYNNVGEHQLTVFADDLEALTAFCQDVGLDASQIESPGVVEQWG